jgi:acyl-CoA reductase-like NAD-dependent aldehyde dehydrogenase
LAEEIRWEALERVVPQAVVAAVGAACGGPPRRCRKLPPPVLLLVLVAMNLFTEEALGPVRIRLIQGL